jgi:hypothetical protein
VMARLKKKGECRHLHIDPYIWKGEDPRKDAVLEWYDKLPSGQRTALVVDLIAAAVLGELGPQVKAVVSDGNTEETIDALKDLLGAFSGEDP